MDRHSYLLQMFSGCQYTRDIVTLYFPGPRCPETRLKAFKRKIASTDGMYDRMVAKGYKEQDEFLSPQVIAVLVDFWGLPDEVERLLERNDKKREVG